MRHVVVMITSSYPRFPGDGVGSFLEPIAKGVAARGHDVHLVAPWHPAITRPKFEDGVSFHFFHYAPIERLNVFGYASGLRADTHVRGVAWAVAPAAFAAGWFKAWRVATKKRATIFHAHWVIPSGVMAAFTPAALPLVVSLHGSDVFVAERHSLPRRAARAVFGRASWITACSDDLHRRAVRLGADPQRVETVPYGVDALRFAPDPAVRLEVRRELGLGDAPLVFSAGRLVSKKGFEYLIDALALIRQSHPSAWLVIAGGGDLHESLSARIQATGGTRVRLLGNRSQDEIARLAAAADAIAVPSIRDDAGNVDGLPNFALESLASSTPVVATTAGALPQAIDHGINGLLVPERDAGALARALASILDDPHRARSLGDAARQRVLRDFGWDHVAERFEAAYDRATSSGSAPRR